MDILSILEGLREIRDSDLSDTEKLERLIRFANNDLDELIEQLKREGKGK